MTQFISGCQGFEGTYRLRPQMAKEDKSRICLKKADNDSTVQKTDFTYTFQLLLL
jgi:hypothetical protein